MTTASANSEYVRLRDMSSVFSRNVFVNVLKFDDYTRFNWLIYRYKNLKCTTYLDLIKKSYSIISKYYACEYVYKNELIRLLLKKYGTKDTAYFSEFRVGGSVADMVMFNGESKAFEIKTEYDNLRRLNKQMGDYGRFFESVGKR